MNNSFNNVLNNFEQNNDNSKPIFSINKTNDKRMKALIDEIFQLMVDKGIIDPFFASKANDIDRLQLMLKFCKA